MGDALGDRMKMYEGMTTDERLMPLLPVIVRIDGRSFSTFTRGLNRPYDERLSNLMVDVTTMLVEETGAIVGYTQSDEITLVLYQRDHKSQLYFDGRVQKLQSALAALATAAFNQKLPATIPEKAGALPTFDCRVFSVPNKVEAVNCLLWREQDATKNSVSMAARAYYSHQQILGKSGPEMQEMLFQKGVNWNDYPTFFKRGTYIQRKTLNRPFTAAELEALPPKHHARTNPDLVVERTVTQRLDIPPLGRIRNRVDVVFDGVDPLVGETSEDDTATLAADVLVLANDVEALKGLLLRACQAYCYGGPDESWLDDALVRLGLTDETLPNPRPTKKDS